MEFQPEPDPTEQKLSSQFRQTKFFNHIFDRQAKTLQRSRAAFHPNSRKSDYLKDEVGRRIVERILDIKKRYDTIVELGSGPGHIIKHLDDDITEKIIMCDISKELLYRDQNLDSQYDVAVERKVTDEENIPFDENSLDMVVSNLSLHWVNDLPGSLIQIRRCLKPDGVFIGAMLGGDTLFELRTSLQLAELERDGGMSPRVSPMTQVSDVGSLLSRAGFTLTTVDIDDIIVNYPSPFELMDDLRAMGESNAVMQRIPHLKRDVLLAGSAIYKELHGNPDGSIPATFQILYMIGWKPHQSQPQPKPRGSATVSIKEVLEQSPNLGTKL
ncbi:S-adenosyl-L-methionine-dependent methyltransferase [Paraphysoderma sedebokerense]|nr:S-adenosyl-L-methionine-dependent methyltransferase [Paraphysoderma sedebokerense]